MIDAADIKTLFVKQLERIANSELREKVVEAWVEGCRQGRWESVEELYAMPFTLLTDTHGVSFVEHTMAVTEGALGLAEAMQRSYRKMPIVIDVDRLIAGGLLHDIGKLLEIEPDGEGGYRKSHHGKCTRHPISGAVLLAQLGFDLELQNVVACHASEGNGRPQVIETVLVHQADFATFNPMVMLEKGLLIK